MPDAIQVAHATEPNFGYPTKEYPDPVYPEGYKTVAIVEAPRGAPTNKEMLRWAFQETSHFSHQLWWKNPSVTLVGSPTHRSTSVGDVVVLPDSRKFLCLAVGWEELCND